jgi:hypothetical protein
MIPFESSEPRAPASVRVSRWNERRRVARVLPVLAISSALVIGAGSAHAEGGSASVPDPAAAALFQSGRDLIDKGQWDEGCAKFEASMTLYPAASTLLNIARCYEHKGKLALAWSAYQRAIVLNRETQGEERRKALDDVAKKGLANVEPRLPRIEIDVKGAPTGLRVTHNGNEIPPAVFGTVVPVDPGPQTVWAEAPGYEPYQKTIDVPEGKRVTFTIDMRPAGTTSSGGRAIPAWAWAAGAGSIALLAGAAVFRADESYIEGKQYGLCSGDVKGGGCPPKDVYDPTGDNARKNRDFGLFVGLGGAGVLALGAAVIGIVTAPAGGKPSTTAITPWIGPGTLGGGIGGRF